MAWIAVTDVSDNGLILTSWGHAVYNNLEFEAIRRTGGTMTGTLLLPSTQSTSATAAVHKSYVDTNYLNKLNGGIVTGTLHVAPDTSTQCLILRSTHQTAGANDNSPRLDFYDATMATRLGYIQATPTNFNIISQTGDIVLNSGGGQVRTSDALYTSGGNNRFFGSSTNICNGGNSAHLDFYAGATNVDSIGTRSGYVGYAGSGHLQLKNENTSGSVLYITDFAHAFSCGATPVEVMRIQPSLILIGKAVSNLSTDGVEVTSTGSVRSTTATAGLQNLYCRHESTANGVNENYAQFMVGGTEVGSISQKTGTTGVAYNTTSDYRLKNDLGPITDGIERIKQLLPKRITWKMQPGGPPEDAFLAHEVTPVVPEAVSGAKDAVAGPPPLDANGDPDPAAPAEDTIVPQQLDYSKLVAVSVAALKDLIGQVEQLTARVTALEAAA